MNKITDEAIKQWAENDILRHNPDIMKDLKALAIRCKQLEEENKELKLKIKELRK